MGLSALNILFLKSIPYIGNQTVLSLLNQDKNIDCNSTSDVIEFLLNCTKQKPMKLETLEFLKSKEKCTKLHSELEKKLDAGYKNGITPLGYNDGDFPLGLKCIKNKSGRNVAPTVIFYKGNIDCLKHSRNITVIGSRNPTAPTKKAASFISEFLSDNDFNIISGLAIGCDEISHSVAVAKNKKTTAILPQGIDKIYPSSNTTLANSIIDTGGILVSELIIGETVTHYTLVERDRIQSALSDRTIVLQTTKNGGSMHAAMSALNNGKKVFIVDYKSINDEEVDYYSGFDILLKSGALKLKSDDMNKLIAIEYKKMQASLFD